MTGNNPAPRPQTPTAGPLRIANLLTPKAAAIAAFAFAVFSMLGQGSWRPAITTLLWGTDLGMVSAGRVMVGWGIGALLMAALAAGLARMALLVSDADPAPWEAELARAAVLVAVVGALLSVVTIVGVLLH